jgi:hypothetical protein
MGRQLKRSNDDTTPEAETAVPGTLAHRPWTWRKRNPVTGMSMAPSGGPAASYHLRGDGAGREPETQHIRFRGRFAG